MRGVSPQFIDPEGLDLPESPPVLKHSSAEKAFKLQHSTVLPPRSQKASSVLFSVADFETPRPMPRKLSQIHETDDGSS